MKRFFVIVIATVLLAVSCVERVDGTKTEFTLDEQVEAAEALVKRVTGEHAGAFDVRINPVKKEGCDWWNYFAEGGKIVIEGNNGVSVASALGAYLKAQCGWHDSWCGKSLELPDTLPLPVEKVGKTSPYRYRYYLNYCTFNYSMSWWDFDRWQQEIDFMALNGLNMPLAVTGQNSVWQRVYNRLGFTDEELESFFSGPAHFNWFWMGNLDGWGGPLPHSFMDKHEEMQKKILYAERSLGMTPVLPAFTGHVPPTFDQRFPEAKVRKTNWVNFDPVTILDPSEPMFDEIGRMFLEEQTALYGTNHFYTADTFNENTPPTKDSLYLNDISAKVYKAMNDVDPDAVWVMQAWLFHHGKKFWGNNEIKALLNAVPDDRMLLLDLWSERYPVWNRTEAYYGKPWIWCMLQNFGQNTVLSGNATSIANDPASALADPASGAMVGLGLTMEGIEQNPAIYALMLENVWRSEPIDIDDFLADYLQNRYGISVDSSEVSDSEVYQNVYKAWQLIFASAYENTVNNGGQESIITGRPNFMKNPGGTTNTNIHYNPADLVRAWDLLIKDAGKLAESDGYRYDLVDVTRQNLANYASVLQQNTAHYYEMGDLEGFRNAADSFIELIRDMDSLLSSRKEFLLGPWLESAKAMGDTQEEKILYEREARDLITVWGDKDCRIRDYACKHWSGLMNGFYLPRWQRFFDQVYAHMSDQLATGAKYEPNFDMDTFVEGSKDWEWTWVNSHEIYPTEPSADEIERSQFIYNKYRNSMNGSFSQGVEGTDKEMI